jgi:hypothetical protein
MKTKVLITMLLLLVCAAIFASEDPGDPAEQWRKTQELNERAERFKAETGFTGEVGHSSDTMRLHTYRGNFSGIHFSAVEDTIAFRQACERIVDKILPYSPSSRSQLSMSRIYKSSRGYTTDYIQQVGGYRVDGAGFIAITYDEGRKHFSIGDNTVDLPMNSTNVLFTEEQAFRIARSSFEKSELCNDLTPPWRSKTAIQFKSRKKDNVQLPYRLYWRITFPGRSYYIDVETGEYFHEGYVINDQVAYTVKGIKYDTSISFGNMGSLPIENVEISNDCDPVYTDSSGVAILPDEPGEWFQVNYQCERYGIRSESYPEIISYNSWASSPNGILIALPDSLFHSPNSTYYAHYSPNILHHMNEQDKVLCRVLNGFSDVPYPIIATDSSISALGQWDPQLGEIQLINGKNSHVIRHEASHFFTFKGMGDHQFYESTESDSANIFQAMDEAFAEYWLSVGINSTLHNYGIPNDITNHDVLSIHQLFNYESLDLNEGFYSWYENRYPLASAWWSLRGNQYFPADGQKNGVDTLLVKSLVRVSTEIPQNNAYRYKPRYFYNILMRRVGDVSSPWPLNKTQLAIDEAYSTRGFHFTPRVISAGSNNPNKEKNKFRIGDPVHVKITNCPQNTPLTVYIVEDQDYTDGMNISSLSILYSRSLSAVDIGDDGSWTGELCNSDSLGGGEYDILVDIGNNGVLHFAYSGANIRDGFDGLTGHGFTVFDDRIEVVTRDFPGISHR